MPRYAKRSYSIKGRGFKRSTSRRNLRRIRYGSTSARSQRKQIKSNQTQLIALKRAVKPMRHPITYGGGFSAINMSSGASSLYSPLAVPLSSGPTQTPSIQAEANDDGPLLSATLCGWRQTLSDIGSTSQIRDTLRIYKQYVDMKISPGSEDADIDHTIFLVKLQKNVATDVYNDTQSMTAFTKHKDFFCPEPPTLGTQHHQFGVYLNTSRYKILKRWELNTAHTGAHTAVGWNPAPRQRRINFTVNYGGTTIKSTGGGPTATGVGDDVGLSTIAYEDIKPENKVWLLCFNNNEVADSQYPHLEMSWIVKGQTY